MKAIPEVGAERINDRVLNPRKGGEGKAVIFIKPGVADVVEGVVIKNSVSGKNCQAGDN